MEKEEIVEKLKEVRIAIKVLCFLYPEAGGLNQPKHAGVVLRRFQQRERDLLGFLECTEGSAPLKVVHLRSPRVRVLPSRLYSDKRG